MVFGFVTNQRTVLFSVCYTSIFAFILLLLVFCFVFNSEKNHAYKEGQEPSLSDDLCNILHHFCELIEPKGKEIIAGNRNQAIKGSC